jgi:hydrogenase maturation protein HypF
VGRWFDVFGAIGLGLPVAAYEGQVAIRWDQAALDGPYAPYAFELSVAASPWEIDLRPALRRATRELVEDAPPGRVAARFHATLVAAAEAVVQLAARRFGARPLVATGGCFQNARLAEGIVAALGSRLPVHLHEHVPPGDGGIALGQALIADAQTSGPRRRIPCA